MKSPQMIDSGRALPPAVVRTNRIIWLAMVLGQLFFAGVIFFIHQQGTLHPSSSPINLMLIIDAMMLAFGAIGGPVIAKMIVKPNATDKALVQQYGAGNIISMALLEGPSFFGLVIVMLSGSWWPAGVVPAICLLLQLLRFPRAAI